MLSRTEIGKAELRERISSADWGCALCTLWTWLGGIDTVRGGGKEGGGVGSEEND